MISLFDPKNINKSASSYNLDKLLWLNAHYIKNSSDEKLIELLKDFEIDLSADEKSSDILKATKERAKTLIELANQINLILQEPLSYNQKVLKKAFGGEAKEILSRFNVTLKTQKPENIEQFHELLQDFVAQNNIGFGKIGQPLRVALLGDMAGAGLDEIMYILGVDEVTKRIQSAINFIESL